MTDQEDKNTIENEDETSENTIDVDAVDTAPEDDELVFDDEAEMVHTELVKKLRQKLKVAVEEKQGYLNNWQKDKAEFINARKRDEESKQDFLKFAKQNVVEDVLPVLDSFEMAMANKASWENVSPEWRAGVEGIYNQLQGILSKHNVTSFGKVGDSFDPNLHQSVAVVETASAEQDHTVAEVLQAGYKMSERVLRPAMVKVFQA
jgi:molecular chaperone GrpE